jgi:hypothetical protein
MLITNSEGAAGTCGSCGAQFAPPGSTGNAGGSAGVSLGIDQQTANADAKNAKSFRDQMNALGVLWILLGGFKIWVVALLFVNGPSPKEMDGIGISSQTLNTLATIVGILGLIQLTTGVLTCFKWLPAVYVGLGFTYLSLVNSLIGFSLVRAAIDIAVIVQGHRVIGMAKKR